MYHESIRSGGLYGDLSIGGLDINVPNLEAACHKVIESARRHQGFTLFTLNLDHVVKLRANKAFRSAYREATCITADGWPIVWLARRWGVEIERTPGADLVDPVCRQAAALGIPIHIIGPSARAQSLALAKLRQRYPSLRIVGAESPEFIASPSLEEAKALAAKVTASGAQLCFVCLGAPKQEILAAALSACCPSVGFLCLGAALDFIANSTLRAPRWAQRLNIEWLWRLISDPRRLGGRYMKCASALFLIATGFSAPPFGIDSALINSTNKRA